MQDDDLFPGNLVENIAVDTEDVDFDHVEAAARLECLHEEIQRPADAIPDLGGTYGFHAFGRPAAARDDRPGLSTGNRPSSFSTKGPRISTTNCKGVLDNLRATGATIIAAAHDERVLARARTGAGASPTPAGRCAEQPSGTLDHAHAKRPSVWFSCPRHKAPREWVSMPCCRHHSPDWVPAAGSIAGVSSLGHTVRRRIMGATRCRSAGKVRVARRTVASA